MAVLPRVYFIVGATATGKTAAGIRLAKALNTEIISADSRQFYQGMAIGTAQPTQEERSEVVHHFVDFLPLEAEYSSGAFYRDVHELLTEYFKSHDSIVVVGGSGLYLKVLTEGFDDLPHDPAVREALKKQLENDGIEVLQKELHESDPKHHEVADISNPQRLIRALEVCRISGKPYSSLLRNKAGAQSENQAFDAIWLGLEAPREALYERINQRVDNMVKAGFEEEARACYHKRHLNALNTVGYKEWFTHFDGDYTREEAIEKIKQHTRNFAKRQLTWFRKQPQIKWFDYEKPDELVRYTTEHSMHEKGL